MNDIYEHRERMRRRWRYSPSQRSVPPNPNPDSQLSQIPPVNSPQETAIPQPGAKEEEEVQGEVQGEGEESASEAEGKGAEAGAESESSDEEEEGEEKESGEETEEGAREETEKPASPESGNLISDEPDPNIQTPPTDCSPCDFLSTNPPTASSAPSTAILDAQPVNSGDNDAVTTVRRSPMSDVGVILGTLGLVSVFVCGLFLFWRHRRKRRFNQQRERFALEQHQEKAFHTIPPGSQNFERVTGHVNSWPHFNGAGAQTSPPQAYQLGHDGSPIMYTMSRSGPAYIPSMPAPAHSRQHSRQLSEHSRLPSAQYSHHSRKHSRQHSQHTASQSLRPSAGMPPSPAMSRSLSRSQSQLRSTPPSPPPPPSVPSTNPVPSGLFANTFELGQAEASRHSVAYTEATNATDSTWTTWNVGAKKRPVQEKNKWIGRYRR